ncbi:hypothetical protein [Actinopolymorpha singaporensis]|uniref:Winged helix DNA-binding domain-containing protein n=1 Tax=Actinopolymorpha singaporensis TaxID=117157 RepID=A0A1H1PAJ2_9ACTN|nr:hypothetical protein [Actinopolymorpha singaporensis]SDS08177.1 hypothetical protein SAMN04489717_1560 [Actinopolymorpha singaporensis]
MEPIEDTWYTRDLPLLRATVRLCDKSATGGASFTGIAAESGMSESEVHAGLRALDHGGYFVKTEGAWGAGIIHVFGVTGEARRVVGSWPSPETAADRIEAALEALAKNAPTEVEKSNARRALEAIRSAGRDVVVSVAAAVITGQIPGTGN